MDADGALDVRALSVRRSRVVLMFAVLASSPGEAQLLGVTVAKKPFAGESTYKP
jgi:hypothetical protein